MGRSAARHATPVIKARPMIGNWLGPRLDDAHQELVHQLESALAVLPRGSVDHLIRALENHECLTRDQFEPIWSHLVKMKDMGPPNNSTPAGLAFVVVSLRDLDHPNWSVQTRYDAAYAALRMIAHDCGYQLTGNRRAIVDLVTDPYQFLIGKDFPRMRDALVQLMRTP